MFIFWGHKGYKKLIGESNGTFECTACHHSSIWQIFEVGKKFSLYFIPLFSYSKSYYIVCPACSASYQISKQEAIDSLQS